MATYTVHRIRSASSTDMAGLTPAHKGLAKLATPRVSGRSCSLCLSPSTKTGMDPATVRSAHTGSEEETGMTLSPSVAASDLTSTLVDLTSARYRPYAAGAAMAVGIPLALWGRRQPIRQIGVG